MLISFPVYRQDGHALSCDTIMDPIMGCTAGEPHAVRTVSHMPACGQARFAGLFNLRLLRSVAADSNDLGPVQIAILVMLDPK